jgi:hypothetical protein
MKAPRDLLRQIEKLEAVVNARARRARFPYVIRVSNPVTESEAAQMEANARARRPYAVMPQKCRSVQDWMGRYGERGSVL